MKERTGSGVITTRYNAKKFFLDVDNEVHGAKFGYNPTIQAFFTMRLYSADGITVLSPLCFLSTLSIWLRHSTVRVLRLILRRCLNQLKNKLVYSKEVFVVCVYELSNSSRLSTRWSR